MCLDVAVAYIGVLIFYLGHMYIYPPLHLVNDTTIVLSV